MQKTPGRAVGIGNRSGADDEEDGADEDVGVDDRPHPARGSTSF
jgi:hypothetical protein